MRRALRYTHRVRVLARGRGTSAGTSVAIEAIVTRSARWLLASLATVGTAAADPTPPPREPCAADVAGAPVPGAESGRTDPDDDGDTVTRQIGRGALFVPKVALDTALQPVRGALWVWDRYQIEDLYYRIFFNASRTIGITPSVGYDYGYGVDGVYGGARFVDRDLFGEHEHLTITAATGAMYRQLYAAELRSGDRFGSFGLILDADFEQHPQDPFYGIGNGDLVAMPASPINVQTDDTAVLARYRQQRARVALLADETVWSSLHVRGGGSLTDLQLSASDIGMPIADLYDTSNLLGWNGVRYAYGEGELRWDSRRRATVYEPSAVFAAGTLASVFGGYERVLAGGHDFGRYGFDVQQFIRIAEGPRVLALRLHGEAVTGSREDVPFTELPRLGGLTYLRGYALDRFRDRVATFGSAEYEWDLAMRVQASVFVDVGRVYDSLGALSADHLRAGYGFALEAHTEQSFVIQLGLASSLDGGLMFNLGFNPVTTLDDRVRRR